jgi:serine/threonine protein kinase
LSRISYHPRVQEPGTVVGERYRLVRKIGEGGLASVWEAEHLTLNSKIAVKFLHRTGPMQSEPSQRFLREARVAASVRHHNVVEIVDFGFAEGEIPYMVMEFLHGRSLGSYLEEKHQLPFDEAASIVAGTLRGLAAVHAAGLVHRDIKPDNIFLVDDPEEGTYPKLVDFGLSRRAGRSDMTAEGTLMGTPQYMSPEQAAGSTDLDARVDIYAMGVVLYEMISGQVPFDSDSLADILTNVIHSPPKPLGELVPEVPEKLAFVVETAMAKDREHRFIDARAMRASLIDSGVYSGADPSSGLITRLSVDDADAVAPTMPSRAAITGSNALLRPDPSGGIARRRDPSTKRSHASDEQVGVFAVGKDDEDANKPTPVTTESPVPRRARSSAGGWVVGLMVFALIAGGIGIAGSSGMFSGGTVAAGAGDGGTSDAETEPDAGSIDDGPARTDSVITRRDAGAAGAVDAGADAGTAAAHPPTKRTGGRHPTKRTTRRRTTRRHH